MAKTTRTVTVGGKTVDFDKLDEVVQLQAQLVPENWTGSKRDGVRLFLALQEMVAQEYKRHLAFNFKNIAHVAIEQQKDNEGAIVSVGFAVEINMSALTVAAIGKTKMSYSRKYSTEGKAKTHDINQGDLFAGDDLSAALDTNSLAVEMAPPPEPEPTAGEEQGHGKPKKSGKKPKKDKAGADKGQ